jgi:hypothetical protein
LATLLIEAILNERLGSALLWLSIILQIKPHWSFVAAVPLLLGRRRFFARLVGLSALIYVAVTGITVLALGPAYGWKQYVDYVQFLGNMGNYFPWRGPEAGYLGYNHSIVQSTVFVLGTTPGAFALATMIKILLLLPLMVVGLCHAFWPAGRSGCERPRLALDLAFALYLGAFIWLDMVWELSLGVPLFAYLFATVQTKITRIALSIPFLLYALLDPLRLVSFALSMIGLDIVDPGPYILTDPNIYLPTIMIAILFFYGVLVVRLGNAAAGIFTGKSLVKEMS